MEENTKANLVATGKTEDNATQQAMQQQNMHQQTMHRKQWTDGIHMVTPACRGPAAKLWT